ncbi:hypothetical protein ACFCX4_33040 [Kitasatospora sp. NPDC056327]|uniref:hypothetical protein n=1 Tax=Kitasatospora sp. NPDC056327 TaxID=3345785 RepID=UPI0035E35C92
MSSDSWPALHGRPVLRRTIAIGLVIFVSVVAALAVRGVNALTAGRGAIETDRDRAELLAGLHPSQHPGAGRYYVPIGAVYTRAPDGTTVAYLHYRLAGGREVGVGDFLRTYDLPGPGALSPLPADLADALGGDEPAEASELGVPLPVPVPPDSPSPAATGTAAGDPGAAAGTPGPSGTAGAPSAGPEPTPAPEPASPESAAVEPGSPEPTPAPESASPDDVLPEDSPDPAVHDPADRVAPASESLPAPPAEDTAAPGADATPAPAVTRAPARGRRIYVAPDPDGLPGAADIYVRATG